jgi:hypothetical protein
VFSSTDPQQNLQQKGNTFPVWWNETKDKEDWSAQNSKDLPAGFDPLTRKIKPVDLLRVKRFLLVKRTDHDIPGGEIPARPYKEAKEWLQKKEQFYQGVGGRDHTLLKADILSGGKQLKKSRKKKQGKKKPREEIKIPKAHKKRKQEEEKEAPGAEDAKPRRSGRRRKSEWKQLLKISGFQTRSEAPPKRRELQQEPQERPKKKIKRSIMTVKPTRVQPRLSAIMKNARTINSAGWRKYQDEGDE